jgi:DNA repair exonuclease SbcCD ATPase subunit
MSIKKIEINNLSSFIDFEFDIASKGSVNKYITIFGTNGSGKSSLVEMLQILNKYKVESTNDNLVKFKEFLSNKISKESINSKVTIDINFNHSSENISYNAATKELIFTDNLWKKIKVFNERYTNATIGTTIDINLKENGLIVGEPNRKLNAERTKQKELNKEKSKLEKSIDDSIEILKNEYTNTTDSKGKSNLDKISKNEFLKDTCDFISNSLLITQRKALGKKKEEQKSNKIDIQKLNNFFKLEYFESLFKEEILKPEITDEYKKLLIIYSDFYEKGINIEDNNLIDKCPYCLQPWEKKEETLNNFKAYLTSEYNAKKEKISSLKKELSDFEKFIQEKNKEIKLQERIVIEECEKYGIDNSKYKTIELDKTQIQNMIDLIDDKLSNMEKPFSVKETLETLQKQHHLLFEISTKALLDIEEAIEKRTTQVTRLNKQISEHMMKIFWEEKKELREEFNKMNTLIETCDENIKELEAKNEDINTIQEVFNGLLKFIGLEEYYLDSNNKLQLDIGSSYDISNEGARISTAQRKILSLCYFYAELISEVSNEKELNEYTLIYDDPLDSADYIFFHSITSLIENIETVLSKILKKGSINIGQHIVFTHNSLLFNRLAQNFECNKKMTKVNKKSKLLKADKLENNYKIYLEIITSYYKNPENAKNERVFIGNIIRRVLEIIISFNELNSNNVSIIKDYGKPTLGMIANHLSHENFSKVLNPLPTDDEMKKACKELF